MCYHLLRFFFFLHVILFHVIFHVIFFFLFFCFGGGEGKFGGEKGGGMCYSHASGQEGLRIDKVGIISWFSGKGCRCVDFVAFVGVGGWDIMVYILGKGGKRGEMVEFLGN